MSFAVQRLKFRWERVKRGEREREGSAELLVCANWGRCTIGAHVGSMSSDSLEAGYIDFIQMKVLE